MTFLYETHLHTREASACAHSRGAEYIAPYMDLGYSGIFVTDHFYNGNSALDRGLPWKEWVKRFCAGYEAARNEGEKIGLDVFFGWEETFNGDDYLVYGLDREWLLEHPEARNWTRKEQYETVKSMGGCVVQAHPFRQHSYINRVTLSTGCVDGVEAANNGNAEISYDALAFRYGTRLGLPLTAGSDMHSAEDVRAGGVFGIKLETKLESPSSYAKILREKKIAGLNIPPGRFDLFGDETVALPVDIRDGGDKKTSGRWRELLGL